MCFRSAHAASGGAAIGEINDIRARRDQPRCGLYIKDEEASSVVLEYSVLLSIAQPTSPRITPRRQRAGLAAKV